ncbi:hypothetical protein C8J57DRAFT_1461330 [Mycena rebaudengoi]|nr:hypothetical protein C8J57DRAFT_1461330 [Mycena rebaudengoi]
MTLDALPAELLMSLPQHLHSVEDLLSLFSTCRALYCSCSDPDPKILPRLVANSGRVFFRPHPHFLIAATARKVADWAVAIQGGVEKLLELSLDVATLTMGDIRNLYAFKCDVINPLKRQLISAPENITVCTDPEITLLSWVIYGELFHHSLELAYLPLPEHKPLGTAMRIKWFVYCMPDETSFGNLDFGAHEISEFFQHCVRDGDRVQQLSMEEAIHELLELWQTALPHVPFEEAEPEKRQKLHTEYIHCVMHAGMKSLQVLVPGGPERLQADLERIASGIIGTPVDTATSSLLDSPGDPWLWNTSIGLAHDLHFTLCHRWLYSPDPGDNSLLDAVRHPPVKPEPVKLSSNLSHSLVLVSLENRACKMMGSTHEFWCTSFMDKDRGVGHPRIEQIEEPFGVFMAGSWGTKPARCETMLLLASMVKDSHTLSKSTPRARCITK